MDLKILEHTPPWEWPENAGPHFLKILGDDQILEALNEKNADIHYHAVCAAGNWAVDAAWPHIRAIVDADVTDKPLLLAAIDAVVNIRPQEATEVLGHLIDDDDQEVVDAVYEALAMAEALNEIDDEDEDDEFLR